MYAKKFSFEQITITILLGLGILIPLMQFLYNRSLWLDDAMLILNIIHKGYFELLKPLDNTQVAPILFLIIEKFFSTLIPDSEYGLRLFPLLCYWASLFFFYKIVRILYDNVYMTILALSLFIFSPLLIYYSNEAKQYMCDVLVYTAMIYFTLKGYKKGQAKPFILSIAGTLAIWLSNVAPIILFVAGLYLLYEQFYIKKTKGIIGLTVVFAIWLIAFAIYYYFFIFNHPARKNMLLYWSGSASFLPFNSLGGFLWFLSAKGWWMLNIFSPRIPIIVIIVLLLITGLFRIISEKKMGLAILTCAPVIVHLFLSGFRLYPFEQRLILYIIPGLIFICTAGFEYVLTQLSSRSKSVNFKLFCFIPIIFLFSFNEFPIKKPPGIPFDVKSDIKFLKENVQDDEAIYVYWLGGFAFQYYQDIGLADFKGHVIIGKENQMFKPLGHKSDYLKVLEKIHGKCWLYFVNFRYWDDEEYIINQLDSTGYNRIKEYKTPGSSIYLYDFK